MTDSFEFTLDNPLTEEQWDMIADVDFDHTDRIWFRTKHGKEVEFTKVIRCKDCKYYRDGDCWHEWDNDGRIYYQAIINEPNPDDYCSLAERVNNEIE